MKQVNKNETVCGVCGRSLPADELIPASCVREPVTAMIAADHPGWDKGSGLVCRADVSRYRSRYVEKMLQAERGELTDVEREVVTKIEKAELVARNVDAEFETKLNLGERVADRVASFGGSWRFITVFAVVLAAWIALNVTLLARRPPDPYPFILLNLCLSCLAAIQAPVIMMSQNRQGALGARLQSQPQGRARDTKSARENRPPDAEPVAAPAGNPGNPARPDAGVVRPHARPEGQGR